MASKRNVHHPHLVRLHAKQQADLDLLDDLRDFVKARAKLDQEYAQGLQKLAQTYLSKRKWPESDGAADANISSINAFRKVLDEAEKIAQKHNEASEQLTKTIVESIRPQSKFKSYHIRRCDDLHNKYQNNFAEKQRKLQQIQKHYSESQKLAEVNRIKFEKDKDVVESGKKSLKTLTKTKTELQEKARRASERYDQSQVDAANARNMYLLSIMAFNTQLNEYHDVDLPDYVKNMDRDYHERLRKYLESYAGLHRDIATAEINSCDSLQSAAGQLSQEYEQRSLLAEDLFATRATAEFMSCPPDTVTTLDGDALQHEALQKEMQRLVNVKAVARKTMAAMQVNIDKTEEMFRMFAQAEDSETVQESENQLVDWKYELVASKWEFMRCSARIDELAKLGIPIPEEEVCVTSAGQDTVQSMQSWEHGQQVGQADSLDMLPDADHEEPRMAIYDYTATANDELTIRANETLTAIGAEDNGWIFVRNASGRQGLVPASYLGAATAAPRVGASARGSRVVGRAIALYNNDEDGMLGFREGDVIDVLHLDDGGDGFWFGRCHGKEGHFLAELVELQK